MLMTNPTYPGIFQNAPHGINDLARGRDYKNARGTYESTPASKPESTGIMEPAFRERQGVKTFAQKQGFIAQPSGGGAKKCSN
jgi:hypothetical protein